MDSIREGIEKRIEHLVGLMIKDPELRAYPASEIESTIRGILQDLKSQNVVRLKDNQELPTVSWTASPGSTPSAEFKVSQGYREAYTKANFKAVEELIDGEEK